MLFQVRQLELRKVHFDETFQPGQIDFTDAGLRQVSPLHATGEVELLANTDGEIRFRGNYTVTLETECDRCLGVARFPLESGFDLFYRPVSDIAVEEEVKIDEGEAEIAFYEGAGLVLEDVLREQILLGMPMQRICQDACKGICPACGANRNEIACDCHQQGGDDRWAALRNLNSSN
jgi:uncharacterized protein